DGIPTAVLWAGGLFLALMALRKEPGALYGGTLAGVILALISGVPSLPALWHSQIVTSFPTEVERALIAATIGVGIGTFAGGLVLIRRTNPALNESNNPSEGGPTDIIISNSR